MWIKKKEIEQLSEFVKGYSSGEELDIRVNKEGSFNILKNDIYALVNTKNEQIKAVETERDSLSDYMADISHQLKTPITSMMIMADLLEEAEPEKQTEFIHNIQVSLNKMEWLVGALLKMAKLDSGTAILQKEKIFIKELILHSAEPLAISMDLHGVKLCLNGNDTDSFQGDFGWSAEAITNILKNGIEHMENGGNLYVSWSEKSVYSEIEIEDEGNGISDEELPHIFERFYRGKTARHSGFGIGMAMAQSIFAKQNGTIKAQNREEGGAKFVIHVRK